jgi:hypothetical protein
MHPTSKQNSEQLMSFLPHIKWKLHNYEQIQIDLMHYPVMFKVKALK